LKHLQIPDTGAISGPPDEARVVFHLVKGLLKEQELLFSCSGEDRTLPDSGQIFVPNLVYMRQPYL
jgi:hypothetical protein